MTGENHSGPDDDSRGNDEGSDDIHVEFGLSVSDLLGGVLGGGDSGEGAERTGRTGAAGTPEPSARDTEPSATDVGEAADEYHVETYREDEHVLVVVDLPGVDFEDVSAGIVETTNDLVVLVEGAVVERVSLPGGQFEVRKSTFNNGVLEIRLRPVGESGA
ncbi:Hsp20/alpha crystallin family protein [Salinigranum sp.]|uniref:Hsp20/alpha crystallin family protein n=1 Tax=Salinigranum sp. TaxID=1966351 RepID=UPI0035618F7B